jgi:hypothetical protein
MPRINDKLMRILTQEGLHVGLFQGGTLRIYSGIQPRTADDPPTGTVLSEFNNLNWRADDTSISLEPVTSTIQNGGNAGYFRITSEDGELIMQGDVGTYGADMNFSSLAMMPNSTQTISSLRFAASTDIQTQRVSKPRNKSTNKQQKIFVENEGIYWE